MANLNGGISVTSGIRPSVDELRDAVQRAKNHDYTSSQITQTDQGAAFVRACLPLRYSLLSLDEIRKCVVNLSRSGKEPGERALTDSERAASQFDRAKGAMLKAYPPADSHSDDYLRQHESDEWAARLKEEKVRCGFRCQGCGRQFVGVMLEGHTVRYDAWREPGMVLIVCRECHPVLDVLRRRGAQNDKSDVTEAKGLFAG